MAVDRLARRLHDTDAGVRALARPGASPADRAMAAGAHAVRFVRTER